MKLQPKPFEALRNGIKIVEIRLYDEKRRRIKIGDTIEFKCEPEQAETVMAKVVALLNYKSFTDLARDFIPECFGFSSKEDLLEEIYTFYTPEQEQKYTVLGIKIKLLGTILT